METYKNYKYVIHEIDVQLMGSQTDLEPRYKTGYTYEILDVYMDGGSESSKDWWDTYSEAESECLNAIEEL